MSAEVISGFYTFEEGRFIPDQGMRALKERVSAMRLLADSGDGVPSFYLDAADQSFWELKEFEDHRAELRQVDRAYIQEGFPTVDPDRPL